MLPTALCSVPLGRCSMHAVLRLQQKPTVYSTQQIQAYTATAVHKRSTHVRVPALHCCPALHPRMYCSRIPAALACFSLAQLLIQPRFVAICVATCDSYTHCVIRCTQLMLSFMRYTYTLQMCYMGAVTLGLELGLVTRFNYGCNQFLLHSRICIGR